MSGEIHPNAYEIVVAQTGESIPICTRETFISMDLKTKAEVFAQLCQFLKEAYKLKKELEALMTSAMNEARNDFSKPVNIPVAPGVMVSLPTGTEDKDLSKKEVSDFAELLHKLNEEAEKEIISYIPSVDKRAVNKWRTVPGPVSDLIVRFYQPHSKSCEIKTK
jgi:hypothetical protein